MEIRFKIWIEDKGKPVFGEGRQRLLAAVHQWGSINRAASELGQSYRKAWASLTVMEQRLGFKLLERQAGGESGGGTCLTRRGLNFLHRYGELIQDLQSLTGQESGQLFDERYAKSHSHAGKKTLQEKTMIRAAVLTISDSSSRGTRIDESGRVLKELVAALPGCVEEADIVADEIKQIQEKLRHYADELGLDLVVTTGGTGISPRDVTPEATRPLLELELPGLPEAMRAAGMRKTPYAMLTRGVAGVRGKTIFVNFPGSPKAVKENFEAVRLVLKHLIEKCQGDTRPCVRIEAKEAT